MKRRAKATKVIPDSRLLDVTGKAEALSTTVFIAGQIYSLLSGNKEIGSALTQALIIKNFIVHSAMNLTESSVGQRFVDKVERVVKELRRPSTAKPITY